ncbi:hypothetical protein ACJ41P_10505 [Azospirillum argentinense]|uniref:Uncharacterized protein n=1 Tax=Azospirillum argentinense TaxID=2970906 RepID=A0ABW8V4X7_9PROT
MTAQHPIIEAMARGIMEARDPNFGNGCGCKVVDWSREAVDNPHVAQALAQARAALRVLYDHGPTPDMVHDGAHAVIDTDGPSGAVAEGVYRAMLAAVLNPTPTAKE